MLTQKIDAIVVGQGVAGSWLSYYLMEAGLSVLVIDNFHLQSSSRIASGIMNPITGHRHVKTWLADSVLPFASLAYRELEGQLGVSFCYDRDLVWLLGSVKDVNDFSVLRDRFGYSDFMGAVEVGSYCDGLGLFSGYGLVHVTYVEMSVFLASYRSYLLQKKVLLSELFSYEDMIINEEDVKWKNYVARWVLFCEGYSGSLSNPFFGTLPFVPAKGEVLLVQIDSFRLGKGILKGGVFVLPTNLDDVFWVGSNYEHDFIDCLPSCSTRAYILRELELMVGMRYKVLEHWASVRPASRDRRPFIGLHPHYSCLGIFNGLGTKGVSLSPFFAKQFVEYLTKGVPLPNEVSVNRIRNW